MATSIGPELLISLREKIWAIIGAVAVVRSFLYYKWWSGSPRYGANPGPKVYPILGCMAEYFRNRPRRHDWATEYMRKLPNLTMRLCLPGFGTVIYTSNPVNVEHILKTKFQIYHKGELSILNFKPLLGNGIFNANGVLWKDQRKVASHEFSAKSLRDCLVEALKSQTTTRLLPLLRKVAKDGSVLDLQDIFMRFGFDNICLIDFGVDTGCLEISLPTIALANAFDEATELCAKRFYMPRFLVGNIDKKLEDNVRIVDEFAMSVIAKRREEMFGPQKKLKSDLLSRFVDLGDNQKVFKSRKKTDKYIRDMLVNFLLAGRDTTSGTLSFFFWELSRNPRVEGKICSELETILSARHSPTDRTSLMVKPSVRYTLSLGS